MYYEFSKNDILLMQQLKVLVASSIKTVLRNARFSRILIHGYFEPKWDTLSCCGVFRSEHDFLLKSASRYCGCITYPSYIYPHIHSILDKKVKSWRPQFIGIPIHQPQEFAFFQTQQKSP